MDVQKFLESKEGQAFLANKGFESVGPFCFCRDPETKQFMMLLGIKNDYKRLVPEAGDVVLPGGARTPNMLFHWSRARVAVEHVRNNLGLEIEESELSAFSFIEYQLPPDTPPLRHTFYKGTEQEVDVTYQMPRTAFHCLLFLTQEQVAQINPAGKLKDVAWVDWSTFSQYRDEGRLSSLVHQIPLIEKAWDALYCELSEFEDMEEHVLKANIAEFTTEWVF